RDCFASGRNGSLTRDANAERGEDSLAFALGKRGAVRCGVMQQLFARGRELRATRRVPVCRATRGGLIPMTRAAIAIECGNRGGRARGRAEQRYVAALQTLTPRTFEMPARP